MSTGDLLLRVECYIAVRKALGHACRSEEKLLNNFVRFLELNGASGPIRAQTAIEWVCAPAHGPAPSGQTNRLRVVRGFLSHLQAFEFETEVPGPGVLPPILRPLPYLYSPDEIAALMKEASRLGPNDSLRPHTYVALIGLLASSGLRVGEALRLKVEEVQRHAIPILKVSDHQRKLVSEIGLVGEYTSGCCLELPPMLWLVIALLGLSVHGRLFASRSKIVE